MTTLVSDSVSTFGGVDWSALRATRSPFWRPGMNTRFEPYVALAETNLGHVVVPCGRDVDQAREVVTRWRGLAEQGVSERRIYGAAVVGPRGEIVEAWKLPLCGSVPDPSGPPRWAPVRRINQAVSCIRCGVERWPGCYVALDQRGCSQCMPLDEGDDPRPWPGEGERPAPETVAKRR